MSFVMCNRLDCIHIRKAKNHYCISYLLDILPIEVKKDGRIICIGYEKKKR